MSENPIVGRTIAEVRAQVDVDEYEVPQTVGRTVNIEIARSGRFLRVQLPGTNKTLSLGEVRVEPAPG